MNHKITQLFERYESGQAIKGEKELVEKWYDTHSYNLDTELSQEEKDRIYRALEEGIISHLPASKKFYTLKRLLQAAAILVIMLSFSLLIYQYGSEMFRQEVTWQKTVVPLGEKMEIILPDRSVIFLNAGSELAVPSNFGDKQREVNFTGEAFFKIHKDSSRPFLINSGKVRTLVLGTSFNIKAYDEDRYAEVSVATGKVKVELKKESGQLISPARTLVPNQCIVFDTYANTYVIKSAITEKISSWRTDNIYFENVPLEEIVTVLNSRYNVSIRLEGIKTNKRYTLHFNKEPLKKILSVICSLSDNAYKITGNNIILTRK